MRLFQVKMEQEQHQTEIRDLQDQLSEMHDELDNAKHTEEGEKEVLIEVSYKVPEVLWRKTKHEHPKTTKKPTPSPPPQPNNYNNHQTRRIA